MKQKVLKTVLLLFFVKLIIIQLSWADWQTPTAIKVGQDGSQKCKIAKYKEYVYVLTAGGGDDKEKLFFYISTDRGGSFDEGRLLSSDENTSDIEIKAAPNGDIHLFWIGGYPRVLHYMKSTNNGAIFSPPLSINVEGDWADDFDCFVKDKDTLYFVFQGSAKPKPEIFLLKSSNGGESFEPRIQVTQNSLYESGPKVFVFEDKLYILYCFDTDDSYEIVLSTCKDNEYIFSSPSSVYQTNNTLYSNDYDMILDKEGRIFISYTKNDIDYHGDLFVAKSVNGGFSFDHKLITNYTYREQTWPKIEIFNDIIYVSWYDYHLNTPEIFLTKSMPPGDTFEINFNVSNDSQKQTIRSMVVDSDGVFILATDYDSYPFSTYLYKTKEMNTPPIISPVSDKQVESGEMIKINFFINDIDHNVNDLQLWVKSSNAALVSTDSILVTGSDQEKTLSITPGEGNIGFTTITIFLSDGENIVKENFTLEVFPKKESQIKITIENPDPGSPYIAPDSNSIVFKGSTAYAVTRVERVELMVSDGIQFLNKNDASYYFDSQKAWLLVEGTITWKLGISGVWSKGKAYTVTARLTDYDGYKSEETVCFTYHHKPVSSKISVTLSDNNILIGTRFTVSGQIQVESTDFKFEGSNVNISLASPGKQIVPIITDDVNPEGFFQYNIDCDTISNSGNWIVQANWNGNFDQNIVPSQSDAKGLTVSKTTIRIQLDTLSQSIKVETPLTITGQFIPQNMCDKIPPDIPIQFTLTDPNNITQTFVTKTKMNNGYFEYVFPSLDMVGYWKVNVKFNENEAYKKSDTVEF